MANKGNGKQRDKRKPNPPPVERKRGRPNGMLVYVLLLTAAFSLRVTVASVLPNDAPDDGRVYDQMARNIVERHVYSHDSEPPYVPSLIRMPGYPLFLAGVYSVTVHSDKTAVRIVQALIDTATCGLIALVAFFWEPDEKRKRRSSIAALAIAAVCPFTMIYVATILSETPTMFLAVGMVLTATLALTATSQRKILLLWVATGLIAGVAVLFRPDSGLFALAIGLTLVFATLTRASDVKLPRKRDEMLYRTARASYLGAVFSLAFCLVLVPWAIRNYRVFHFFQPLSPAHAEMPGEFVPRGYLVWVRTWIDNDRYIGPAIWALDEIPIKPGDLPDSAFDSVEEKQRVGKLLDKYNHPADEPDLFVDPALAPSATPQENQTNDDQQSENDNSDKGASPGQAKQAGEVKANDNASDEDKDDSGDEEDQGDEDSTADQPSDQAVEMTPELDAGFAQLARERIARHPLRYYVLLPLKRAHSLWFNTHSDYYPFQGDLLPLDDLDHRHYQQYALPLFALLTFLYTVLGLAGGWFLWRSGDFVARQWVLMAALLIFLRLGFFSTMENPEPRYTVEFFPFLAILGGMAVVRLGALLNNRKVQS